MSKSQSTEVSSGVQKLVKFQDDPECVAYQFIRPWADKDNHAVTNSKGEQIKSASAVMTGGGWKDGYTLAQLNRDILAGTVIAFVNGKVIVYRPSTREPYNSNGAANIAA